MILVKVSRPLSSALCTWSLFRDRTDTLQNHNCKWMFLSCWLFLLACLRSASHSSESLPESATLSGWMTEGVCLCIKPRDALVWYKSECGGRCTVTWVFPQMQQGSWPSLWGAYSQSESWHEFLTCISIYYRDTEEARMTSSLTRPPLVQHLAPSSSVSSSFSTDPGLLPLFSLLFSSCSSLSVTRNPVLEIQCTDSPKYLPSLTGAPNNHGTYNPSDCELWST